MRPSARTGVDSRPSLPGRGWAKRLTLLGCGKMGRAAAYSLAIGNDTAELTLVDRDGDRAADLACWLAERSSCPVTVSTDVESAVMGRDAVAMAIPWSATRAAIDAALQARVPAASITRPPADELVDLDDRARVAGVALLLPVGLEPGLTELLAVRAAEQFDEVETVAIRCGDIPRIAHGPLWHRAFFGGDEPHHLPIAQRSAWVSEGGRLGVVPRFSGLEVIHMAGVGKLEAYHDGMVPWLPEHPALLTADCTQKTLRWPGFAGTILMLAQLGLLDERPVDVDGVTVPPRRVVERVLEPRSRPEPGEEDLVVLEVTVHGRRHGRPLTLRCLLLDRYDRTTSLSAVARTTGFMLASAAGLLANGSVAAAGWRPPHVALSGAQVDQVITALTRVGVSWSPPAEIGPSHGATSHYGRRGLETA